MARKLLALGLDAFYETLDKKSLQIVCALSLLVVICGAGLGFAPTPFEEVASREIPRFVAGPMFASGKPPIEVTKVVPRDDGAYRVWFIVTEPAAVRRMQAIREYQSKLTRGQKVGRRTPFTMPMEQFDKRPLTQAEVQRLLETVGRSLNYGFESARELGRGRHMARFRPPYPQEIASGGKLNAFGLFEIALPPRLSTNTQRSFADLVLDLQWFVANWVAGFFGIILAIVFTGGLFPAMLRPGSIDLLLARPIHRATLFTGKYLGGLLYVFCFTVVLIGGFWLSTSLRSGLWSYGFLLTIFSITLLFAVIYTISVFWSVVSGSTVTTILMTMVATFCFVVVTTAKNAATEMNQMEMAPDWLVDATRALYWIFPSTSDFDVLNAWCISRAPISEGLREQFLASANYYSVTAGGPLWVSIGSSVLFAFVVFCISCWIFCRKEF